MSMGRARGSLQRVTGVTMAPSLQREVRRTSALLRDDQMPNIASRALVDARRGCMFDNRGYRFEKPG